MCRTHAWRGSTVERMGEGGGSGGRGRGNAEEGTAAWREWVETAAESGDLTEWEVEV